MKMIPAVAASMALVAGTSFAQTSSSVGCDSAESRQLDFWVGDWELTTVGQKVPGTSRNKVSKILGGCVILEEFDGSQGSKLVGKSFSSFDRATKKWKQTWVDNTASYLDFDGGMVDGNMSFWREAVGKDGKKERQRMIFKDVKQDSLKWLWQKSEDEGKSWKTEWEIDYKRVR